MAFTLSFASIDPSSGLADSSFTWGNFWNEDSQNIVNINQEIIGGYFITADADFEGIVFLLEDGSFHRVGEDKPYTYDIADINMLPARLIGF